MSNAYPEPVDGVVYLGSGISYSLLNPEQADELIRDKIILAHGSLANFANTYINGATLYNSRVTKREVFAKLATVEAMLYVYLLNKGFVNQDISLGARECLARFFPELQSLYSIMKRMERK